MQCLTALFLARCRANAPFQLGLCNRPWQCSETIQLFLPRWPHQPIAFFKFLLADVTGRDNSGRMQTHRAEVCTVRKSKAGGQSRIDAMNLKSCRYMEGTEFRTRQSAFSFFCEQALEYLKTFSRECAKGWRELFKIGRSSTKQEQLKLFWDSRHHGRKTVESWNGYRLMSS